MGPLSTRSTETPRSWWGTPPSQTARWRRSPVSRSRTTVPRGWRDSDAFDGDVMNPIRQSTLLNGLSSQARDGADRFASPRESRPLLDGKRRRHQRFRIDAVRKLLTTVLLTAATAFAQSSDRLPVTDAEKIADALRAGPAFVTKDATCWIGLPRLEANTGSFVKGRTN